MLKQLFSDLGERARSAGQQFAIAGALRLGFVPKQALDASLEANKTLAGKLAQAKLANAQRANAKPSVEADAAGKDVLSGFDYSQLTPEQKAQAKAMGLIK